MRPQIIHLCLLLALLGAGLNLAGCQQPPYHLDTRYHAANQESRIQYLVVHYTQIDDTHSLYELTRRDSGVSAHYLISRAEHQGKVSLYPLVPDSERAWHAGRSHWQGAQALNSASIGIEIVNRGYEVADAGLPLDQRRWQSYTEAQFHAVASLLHSTKPKPADSGLPSGPLRRATLAARTASLSLAGRAAKAWAMLAQPMPWRCGPALRCAAMLARYPARVQALRATMRAVTSANTG